MTRNPKTPKSEETAMGTAMRHTRYAWLVSLMLGGFLASACGDDRSSAPLTPLDEDASGEDVAVAPVDADETDSPAPPGAPPRDVSVDDGVAETFDADTSEVDLAEIDPDVHPDVEADDADATTQPRRCAARGWTTEFGDDLVAGVGPTEATLPRCHVAAFRMVVPSDVTWRVEAADLPEDARLFVHGPGYHRHMDADVAPAALASTTFAGPEGALEVTFTAVVSGEQTLVITRDDVNTTQEIVLEATCIDGCTRETSRFPIALVHGYAGIDSYFGVLEYFYDVPDRLRSMGYVVFTPVTAPVARSERRARELAAQIDAYLDETGARRINLIGHSQGGLDARLMVAGLRYHDRVASVTTIATPHHGVPLQIVDFLSIHDFSEDAAVTFNRAYPDHEDVRYWSWSARSCAILDSECQSASDGERINALLIASFNLLRLHGDNDGVVTTESMIWGEHLGLLFADHFDQVGQIAVRQRPDMPFDHRRFYVGEARRLAAEGL